MTKVRVSQNDGRREILGEVIRFPRISSARLRKYISYKVRLLATVVSFRHSGNAQQGNALFNVLLTRKFNAKSD